MTILARGRFVGLALLLFLAANLIGTDADPANVCAQLPGFTITTTDNQGMIRIQAQIESHYVCAH